MVTAAATDTVAVTDMDTVAAATVTVMDMVTATDTAAGMVMDMVTRVILTIRDTVEACA